MDNEKSAEIGQLIFSESNGIWVVKLHDGGRRVELNEDVTFDEAARCFWAAVSKIAKTER